MLIHQGQSCIFTTGFQEPDGYERQIQETAYDSTSLIVEKIIV